MENAFALIWASVLMTIGVGLFLFGVIGLLRWGLRK